MLSARVCKHTHTHTNQHDTFVTLILSLTNQVKPKSRHDFNLPSLMIKYEGKLEVLL